MPTLSAPAPRNAPQFVVAARNEHSATLAETVGERGGGAPDRPGHAGARVTLLNLRRLRIALAWGESVLHLVRRGHPILARITARTAATWAFRALEKRP